MPTGVGRGAKVAPARTTHTLLSGTQLFNLCSLESQLEAADRSMLHCISKLLFQMSYTGRKWVVPSESGGQLESSSSP